MKEWLRRLSGLLAALLLLLLLFAVPTIWYRPWLIDHFYARVLLEEVFDDPLLLTQVKLLESVGLRFHADDLPDFSMAERQRVAARWARELEVLGRYDRESLTREEQLSYDAMSWWLEIQTEASHRFLEHPYAVDQLSGLHVRFPDVMVTYHLIEDVQDAENYLARLKKSEESIDQVATTAETLHARGYTLPGFILRKILRDAEGILDTGLEENTLYVDLSQKVQRLADLTDAERRSLLARLEETLEEHTLPGYRAFVARLGKLEAGAGDDAGVWHLPEGGAYYDLKIRQETTTRRSADEIHELGLEHVGRLQAEMGEILEGLGIEAPSIAAAIRALSEDSRFLYPDDEAGRKQILADYEQIIREIESGIGALFQTDPGARVVVEAVPAFKEKTAPFAYYFPPALDGSKPGVFFANLRDVKAHPKWGMRTLAFHEAIPGHHSQLTAARTNDRLPMFRRLRPLNAYTEGWALYAEQLAAENGYQEDPYDRLGYLNARLFRVVRLVVDTGLHRKRWSRQEAMDYMFENLAMERGEIEAEVDRYVVWPGQALGYMVGYIQFMELRDRARASLGDDFDLRQFHDAVLLEGALPLVLLERVVEDWIASQGRSAPS